MTRFNLPRRDPSDRTPNEIAQHAVVDQLVTGYGVEEDLAARFVAEKVTAAKSPGWLNPDDRRTAARIARRLLTERRAQREREASA